MTDSTNTKIVETIFGILDQHGFIKSDTNIDEATKQACVDCLPVIEQIQQDDTSLYRYLEQLMKVLDIDCNAKNSLDTVFKTIINEIICLKKKFVDQDKRLAALENNMKLEHAHLLSYDLLRLILFYFVEPALDRTHQYNWNQFTSKLKILKKK